MVRTTLALVLSTGIVLTAGQTLGQITNGSFEAGFTGWGTQDLDGPFYGLVVAGPGTDNSFGWPWSSTPTDGTSVAYHGFDGDGGSGSVSTIRIFQDVFINAGLLNFDHRHAWDLTFGGLLDRSFDVNVNVAGGGANLQATNILVALQGTTVLDTGPMSSTVDVSAFVGSTVEISFDWTVPEDFTGPAAAQLDNIILKPIPEPASVAVLAIGTLALFRRRR